MYVCVLSCVAGPYQVQVDRRTCSLSIASQLTMHIAGGHCALHAWERRDDPPVVVVVVVVVVVMVMVVVLVVVAVG
jgi:hypothetical protein